jgi:hypothetical protein
MRNNLSRLASDVMTIKGRLTLKTDAKQYMTKKPSNMSPF